jgi:hypothetical protein
MNPSYNDDVNQQLLTIPPTAVQVQPQSSSSFMDYVRDHKLAVAIVIIVIIGLIWWFCIRKNTGASASTTVEPTSGSRINVTRTKIPGTGTSNLY